MIDSDFIETQLREIFTEKDFFLVDIKVDKNNRILVHVDRDGGLSIDDCVWISRELEARLDRDKEDFALEVSSPGLDSPFKVHEQYLNSTGQEVRIILKDGKAVEGILSKVSDLAIEIAGGKTEPDIINFNQIKSAKRRVRI